MERDTLNAAPQISLEAAQEIVETKTAPRVTEETIRSKIGAVSYALDTNIGLTICLIQMQNGFVVLGKSAPAHMDNFDPLVGERYAFEDAFRQLWALEGYLLKTKLHEGRI